MKKLIQKPSSCSHVNNMYIYFSNFFLFICLGDICGQKAIYSLILHHLSSYYLLLFQKRHGTIGNVTNAIKYFFVLFCFDCCFCFGCCCAAVVVVAAVVLAVVVFVCSFVYCLLTEFFLFFLSFSLFSSSF